MHLLDGRSIINRAISQYGSNISLSKPARLNIAFHFDQSRYSYAAATSTRSKLQYFDILGIPTRVVGLDAIMDPQFRSEIHNSEFVELFVFQRPFPQYAVDYYHSEDLVDLDKISSSPIFKHHSAVVEAIANLVLKFKVADVTTLAVVGSKGRFGSQILEVCQKLGFRTQGYDIGSDLSELAGHDIVVSAVGAKGLIKSENLSTNIKLLADLGFSVQPGVPELYYGDVDPSAYKIPQCVTPVPGGVGPLQVLTLIERAFYAINGEIDRFEWAVR